MVDVTTSYDVKKLLFNSSGTIVAVINEESREIAVNFAVGVMKTWGHRVARVQAATAHVENTAQGHIQHSMGTIQLPF